MPDLEHPPWCSPRRCTAAVPPVNGHAIATHRSAPEASGLTEVYLVQSPDARLPSVEFTRPTARPFPLPLSEAGGIPEALRDLLAKAGVRL